MKVKDVIAQIRFNTSTAQDLSGKNVNNLFSNRDIVRELDSAMTRYAIETQALEAIHSVPFDYSLQSVAAPPRALRTEAYKLIVFFIQGRMYLLNMPSMQDADTFYPFNSFSGTFPAWVVPWKDQLYIYPSTDQPYASTTLTQSISKDSTTLYVENTGNYPKQNGRITIGEEKILYGYSQTDGFYGCTRGIEDTIATSHPTETTVKENNLHFFYYKKHFEIPVESNDIIDAYWLNMPMEIPDEHLEVICDFASYKLLAKIDIERASFYKIEFDKWLQTIKDQLKAGRSQITNTKSINYPYISEGSNYFRDW